MYLQCSISLIASFSRADQHHIRTGKKGLYHEAPDSALWVIPRSFQPCLQMGQVLKAQGICQVPGL